MNYLMVASLALLGLGVILFFVLASSRSYRRHPAVEHYKDARDTLSGVEPVDDEKTPEPEDEGRSPGSIVSALVGFLITVVIGTTLFSTVRPALLEAANVSGGAGYETVIMMLNLMPLLFGVVGVMALINVIRL